MGIEEVKFWGAFSHFGKTPLVEMHDRQTFEAYTKSIEEHILPSTDEHMPVSWEYQQDNAPIRVSQHS